MRVCLDCNTKMVAAMSFQKDKKEKFLQCPNCHAETRHHILQENELDFGEVLNREVSKRFGGIYSGKNHINK